MPQLPPPLAPSGDFSRTTPDVIMRWCELVRFTGTLAYTQDARRGVLPMVSGVPEIPDGDEKVLAAFDEFSELTSGRYTLTQLLPPLEGATPMSDLVQRGSLEKTPVSELLRYSEGAGLTGKLSLHSADGRSCVARYRRGELESITVDEKADADLSDVFAWNRGTFIVQAVSVFESERPATTPHVAAGFLQTVEVALTELVARSEKVAEKTRQRPPSVNNPPSLLRHSTVPFGVQGDAATRPPPPAERRSVVPPPPPPHDGTVKVYIVPRESVTGPSVTQHSASKLGSEVVPLDPLSTKAPAVKDAAAVLAEKKPANEPAKPTSSAAEAKPVATPKPAAEAKPVATPKPAAEAKPAPAKTDVPPAAEKGWTDAPVTRSTEPSFVTERAKPAATASTAPATPVASTATESASKPAAVEPTEASASLVPEIDPIAESPSGSFPAATGTATPIPAAPETSPPAPVVVAVADSSPPAVTATTTAAVARTPVSLPLTALFGTTLALSLGAAVYILVGLLR